jgi:hypothetical protein
VASPLKKIKRKGIHASFELILKALNKEIVV